VGGDHPVPVLERNLVGVGELQDAGDVAGCVESAEVVDGFLNPGPDGCGVADVADSRDGVGAALPEALGQFFERLLLNVRAEDAGAFCCQALRGSAADSRGGTGDESDLPFESSHPPLL
jgi:hypothetical protein